MRNMIKVIVLISTGRPAHAGQECSAPQPVPDQTGLAGPGIRSGGWTQQPAAATNNSRPTTNLSPSRKNAMPPPRRRFYQR